MVKLELNNSDKDVYILSNALALFLGFSLSFSNLVNKASSSFCNNSLISPLILLEDVILAIPLNPALSPI